MKQINLFKNLLLVALLCASGAAIAQVHPLAYGFATIGGTANPYSNWYADYVGMRFEVVSPASVAGDKVHTTTNDGNPANTSNWGGLVTTPITNVPVVMPQAGDSLAGGTITVNMTGKIALVYRGGGVLFGDKAYAAQLAGAVACVIINNQPGGPVGMASGGSGPSVVIPIFMISKTDGDALDALYNAGTIANITITSWGQGYQNDLGFVPGGAAGWHAYAVPKAQLTSSGNPSAYKGMDGAFIANYGSNNATHVQVSATLSWNPSTGGTSQIHTDTSGTLATFTQLDSIYAMFAASDYNITAPTATGRYDLTYKILSDSIDQFSFDNTQTYSYYATDSLYSKGRYDFTTNQPLRTIYESFNGGNEYMWGPMYYVAKAGTSISRVQYSIALPATSASPILNGTNNVYLFKWVDGSNGHPLDSILQDGELQLISLGIKVYDGINDTSNGVLNLTTMADSNGSNSRPVLDSQSWYYLTVDVPSLSSAIEYLGCDGILDAYPRIYGRYYHNAGTISGIYDYSNLVVGGTKDSVYYYPNQGNTPIPATYTAYINSVDSFIYSQAKGLIPAVSMYTQPTVGGVKNTAAPFANVSLYPNPASDYLTVSLELQQPAKRVTYEIIDGLARFVSKEVHNNVQNEKKVIDTKNLKPGNYYLIISADDKIMSRTFTVTK